jgi:hypothetical protein
MTTVDPTTLTADELAPMLRAWASGLFASEAAVELLIAHDVWARRRDFLFTLVDAVDDGWAPRGAVVPMTAIDWDRVEALLASAPASRSEISVLRLAASLAGSTVSRPLHDATAGLDETNTTLVLNAIAHRCGWHERGTTRLITGTLAGSRPDVDDRRPPAMGGYRPDTRGGAA